MEASRGPWDRAAVAGCGVRQRPASRLALTLDMRRVQLPECPLPRQRLCRGLPVTQGLAGLWKGDSSVSPSRTCETTFRR